MGISDENGRRVFLGDLHADVVGELKVQTGEFQAPAWFSPYGERTPLDAQEAPGMLGYQGDPTTQASADSPALVDMTARYYAPELGRFTIADALSGKVRDPMSMNQWIYGADDH
jgi:RHS repeat-associated protein